MDSEHNISVDTARETPYAGAGAQLRAAREALRLDLTHVAAQTRIPLRHLEAIERGDFAALPSRTYAIGFSRTFAGVVGLDPAQITNTIREELSDGSAQRPAPASAMEPGDPARLPSSGLAWAGALAALVLLVGALAFYNAYFGAGAGPGSLLTPAPAASSAAAPAASAVPSAGGAAAGGEVVLTATEDGIWLRLYQEAGERLFERTLTKGETVTVPISATDPRINTGRPDALAITVGGKPVPPLATTPVTLSGVSVSAAGLLARAAPTAGAEADPAAVAGAQVQARAPASIGRPVTRRVTAPAAITQAPSDNAAATAPSPPPAAEPAPANDRSEPAPNQR
jgi:cytoskeleton protein RodZ